MSKSDFNKKSMTLLFGGMTLFLAIMSFIKSKNTKRQYAFYKSIADYVQKGNTEQRYAYFVKNRKFGLLDRKKCEVTIPAQYDKLIYSLYLKNLLANNNGCWFMIDKQGKRLSKDYDSLTWRNDQLLDAERDGKHYVIDIYGNELS